ncbi:MAG: neutral zinc metallopeptidase [Nevskia sp.]|nr:neutral zinc metallopeptidase [Nevskia sp.]
MRWGDARRSDNVEDRRGMSVRGAGGIGLGTVAIALLLSWITGTNPLTMLGLVSQVSQGVSPPAQSRPATPGSDAGLDFVSAVLGDTEDVWGAVFQHMGRNYEQPHLVLFSGSTQSACGGASAAAGPFYCPGDHKVYLDLDFFNDMRSHLGGGGDFAQAYVIAHEVGHHVQNLLGISDRVEQARRQGASMDGAAGLSVRLELQADCLAGVWANLAQKRHQWLDQNDVKQALDTATAIGDDRLQKQAQGYAVPDSFTHGSSDQRVRWFRQGFGYGDAGRCDTFAADSL